VVVRPDGRDALRRGLTATLGTDSAADARALGSRLAEILLDAGAADLAALGTRR